jgi:hypothetical protein
VQHSRRDIIKASVLPLLSAASLWIKMAADNTNTAIGKNAFCYSTNLAILTPATKHNNSQAQQIILLLSIVLQK